MRNYKLDGHNPVPCDDTLEWAQWYEKADRRIALTDVAPDVHVSTVFLSIDHNWGDGPPVLFETMVFGGPLDEEQVRYCTWDEAELGHAAMVERVKAKP